MFDVEGTMVTLVVMSILFAVLFFGFKNMASDLVPTIEARINDKIDEVSNTLSEYALTVEEKIESQIQLAIDGVGEAFAGIVSTPAVKGAMSVLGTKGAEARAETRVQDEQKSIIDSMATDLLDSKFGGVKLIAETIGIDLDGYIEDHGAIATIQALRQGGQMFGIDVDRILADGMSNLSVGHEANGSRNPYLK